MLSRCASFFQLQKQNFPTFLLAGAKFCTKSSEMKKLVLEEKLETIYLIGINRPEKRNCVNQATARELVKAFQNFEADKSATVAVLYGVGGNFCAGYDLSEVAQGTNELLKIRDEWRTFRPMGPTMMRFSKPVIAAVAGYAVAGGLELSLMCDLRVAEENAIFGVFCRRFGVPLIDGGTIRLPKLIGLSRAMDMILTGREVNAKTAGEWGLANIVVPIGASLGQAVSLARNISRFPQECMKIDRNSAYFSTYDSKSYEDAFNYELENGLKILDQESVQGAKKFVTGIGKHGSFNLHDSKL